MSLGKMHQVVYLLFVCVDLLMDWSVRLTHYPVNTPTSTMHKHIPSHSFEQWTYTVHIQKGQWFWRPDVWRKILEGRWKSKNCLKKQFSNIERFLVFLTFPCSQNVLIVPSKRWKLFFSFSNMANGASKNLSFYTNFKNVNMISVKS